MFLEQPTMRVVPLMLMPSVRQLMMRARFSIGSLFILTNSSIGVCQIGGCTIAIALVTLASGAPGRVRTDNTSLTKVREQPHCYGGYL